MTLIPGTRLGVYNITAPIGEGGMGQVFRARDTRLNRDVALKVLPDSFASDPDRLARFTREAQTLASLNHPHIAAIYGLEESGGLSALVMELVEGEDLSQRLARGAIPIDEALPIAQQIAEALEAAHEQGIIHRDLKPANIKVRADGTVKVLDFGLAKAVEGASGPGGAGRASGPGGLSVSPTLTTPAMTLQGMILGTAAYMAPEQAKGKSVDKRADIWAFGCVLYEMLTGQRAFSGEDVSDTLALVLTKDPDWTALPPQTPAAARLLLRRCIQKDRRKRLASAADAALEIDEAMLPLADADRGASVTALPKGLSAWHVLGYCATALAAIVMTRAIDVATRPGEIPRPVARLTIELPPATQLSAGGRNLAISPDGTRVVYATNGQLDVRLLDQATPSALIVSDVTQGTEAVARGPMFSPDGQWVAFFRAGHLQKVRATGGSPVTICDLPTFAGGTWDRDGEILIANGRDGILRVDAAGGIAQTIIAAKPTEGMYFPQAVSDEWLLFLSYPVSVSGTLSTGTGPDDGELTVQSRVSGERRVLLKGARDFRYVASGHLVFGRGNGLFAQPFDAKRGQIAGQPVPILDGVDNTGGNLAMHFAISTTGTIVYLAGTRNGVPSQLIAVTRSGVPSTLATFNAMPYYPRFSRDGERLAYALDQISTAQSDLWITDVARGARTRITYTGFKRFYPIWTPDSAHLTFADNTGGETKLIQSAPTDGSGTLDVLFERPRAFPTSWSPDGRTLALYAIGSTKTRDIFMLHIDGDKRTLTPFVETPFEEAGPIFSPNGKWVAYVSKKSRRNEVYARPFPGPGNEVTVSVGGGQEPVWASSGRELFYRRDKKLIAVPVAENGSTLAVGNATALFDDSYELDSSGSQGGVANYDIAPDGKRFVMVGRERAAQGSPTPRLQVILNWFEELKARVPTK